MDFGNQIKILRKSESLTQEDLSKQLNVSRQTISSWENNRNLPDLEMVVRISTLFNLSLDQLILGDNNMTKKLVNDGSEQRKLKFHTLSVIVNCIAFFLLIVITHFVGTGALTLAFTFLIFSNFLILQLYVGTDISKHNFVFCWIYMLLGLISTGYGAFGNNLTLATQVIFMIQGLSFVTWGYSFFKNNSIRKIN